MTDYVQVMKCSWFQSLFLALIAISLLASCGADGNQMREQLAQLEEQNRSDEQMLNDSLAEQLVDYFDRHGTANERMRARYMLGRTYFDLGELPRALETYYTARDCADTTAADCDYKVLSRIHAQSAQVFYNQVQPRSHLAELQQAVYYAQLAGDTLQAIECYSLQAESYKLLHMLDSAIMIKENAADMYKANGKNIRYALKLGGLIGPLVQIGDINKAKQYIDEYETISGLFDSDKNIQEGREIYYYLKGEYYIAINRMDSAEYLFRKELRLGKDLNNQIAGCKGLQRVFERLNKTDSIAKYAELGYLLNDSAFSLSEMQNVQRLKAAYDYSHNKQIAEENRQAKERAYWLIMLVLFILVIVKK